jgi:hypothetical protein
MAEHRDSEALPKGNCSESNDEQKAEEIKERVAESPPATESRKDDLPNSIEHNSETLIAFPSSVLQNQSIGTPQFSSKFIFIVIYLFLKNSELFDLRYSCRFAREP